MPATSTLRGPKPILFADHFKLRTSQEYLDFVNVPLNTDAPLFLDPWAFKLSDELWSIECNNLLIDFFQRLLAAIRAIRLDEARNMLRPLREPNATRLGLSVNAPKGKGMGPVYSQALVDHLRGSRAFQTGLLRDLADCELMIPHVSNDRISDITSNVVNRKLVEFTTEQCKAWGIKTARVPAGPTWNPTHGFWESIYADLPQYLGKPIILVPKSVVRRKMSLDHEEYWRHFCLEYLQQEHMNSNSALCRVLKDGTRVPPYKKDLEHELPCDKDELLKFTQKHPGVLKQFKDAMAGQRSGKLKDSEIAAIVGENATLEIRVDRKQPGIKIVSTTNNININGSVIGGTIGGGTVNARDISQYKQLLDSSFTDKSVREHLLDARTRIETAPISPADKADASDTLGRITAEIHKPEPDRPKLAGWVDYLAKLAPATLTALKGVKIIADIIQHAS